MLRKVGNAFPVIPTKAGIQYLQVLWTPDFTGVTTSYDFVNFHIFEKVELSQSVLTELWAFCEASTQLEPIVKDKPS